MHNWDLSSRKKQSTVREMASEVDNPSASKNPHLSLSLKRNRKETMSFSRFLVVSDADVEKAAKGVVVDNTVRSNAWARKNFKKWARIYSAANPSCCPRGSVKLE